jgi:hypothetical protein
MNGQAIESDLKVLPSSATTLLVIGIHREELAFGAAVAAGLDRGRFDVLKIPEGLSGRHPRADQRFHFDTLHRALYLQLLPHIQPCHARVIDLHTGLDPHGPCSDIYCRDSARLAESLTKASGIQPVPRLISLLPDAAVPSAATVIPPEIWRNPRFLYVGVEIYLPETGAGHPADLVYASTLLNALSAEST